MKTGSHGLELITSFEGLELEAYQDIVGIWTIGYGHTDMAGPPIVTPGMEITEAEAVEILRRDLVQFEQGVEKAVNVPITQKMFDALVSISFNIGVNGMRSSTFIKRLNNEDYEGAAEAMKWWNKAGGKVVNGLARRREAEAALFLEGAAELDSASGAPAGGVPVEENAPRRDNIAGSRTISGSATGAVAGATAAGTALMSDEEDSQEAEKPAETVAPEAQPAEDETPPAEETSTEVGTEDEVFVSRFDRDEARQAIIIVAGVVAILAALYVIMVRIDDWRNHRR